MAKRELNPGTMIHNRYRVDRVLGAGGFGVTYQVTDTRDNTIAAMKEYMPLDIAYRPAFSVEVRPVSEDKRKNYERFRQQFLEEAQTIYKFQSHPNIVKVSHLFYENNTAYYVMEYISGMDLGKFLQKQGGRISWEMLKPIMAQVISALKQIHQGGIIHCDVSPENTFLVNAGQVKLLDFGAAKNVLRGSVDTSMVVGRPHYSPYEQMHGKAMGPWTDVYATAVTIYRCLTGKVPPLCDERLTRDTTVWPSQMGIPIPSAAWEQALRRGMAVRPDARYQNVTDFWQDLCGNDMTIPMLHTQGHMAAGVGQYGIYQQPRYQYPQLQQGSGWYPVLEGIQGRYTGQRIPVQGELYLGVDGTRCRIAYPTGSPGISRVHLRIWADNGQIMIMDMNSTYGSYLNGKKMTPGLAYPLAPGSTLYMGDGQTFRALPPGS